ISLNLDSLHVQTMSLSDGGGAQAMHVDGIFFRAEVNAHRALKAGQKRHRRSKLEFPGVVWEQGTLERVRAGASETREYGRRPEAIGSHAGRQRQPPASACPSQKDMGLVDIGLFAEVLRRGQRVVDFVYAG